MITRKEFYTTIFFVSMLFCWFGASIAQSINSEIDCNHKIDQMDFCAVRNLIFNLEKEIRK